MKSASQRHRPTKTRWTQLSSLHNKLKVLPLYSNKAPEEPTSRCLQAVMKTKFLCRRRRPSRACKNVVWMDGACRPTERWLYARARRFVVYPVRTGSLSGPWLTIARMREKQVSLKLCIVCVVTLECALLCTYARARCVPLGPCLARPKMCTSTGHSTAATLDHARWFSGQTLSRMGVRVDARVWSVRQKYGWPAWIMPSKRHFILGPWVNALIVHHVVTTTRPVSYWPKLVWSICAVNRDNALHSWRTNYR
jgi:hypothetical protein